MRSPNPVTQPTIVKPSRRSVVQRLFNLVSVIIISVLAVHIWVNGKQQEQVFIAKQSRIIGESYIAQTARVHYGHQLGASSDKTQKLLNDMLSESYVYSVSLLAPNGEVIFTSDTEDRPNLSLSQQASNDYLIYVEPLLLEGNIIGFNRVILYRHDVQKLQREHYQQRSNETLFLTLLALFIGGLITSNIYTFKNNGKHSSKGVSQ